MKLRILFLILLNFLCFKNVFAGVYIYEIFPNTEDDSNLEYIELYNSGNEELSLSGYILKDKSDKEFIFGETDFLGANERKKYYRPDTKILLNNSDEEIFLYNSGNILIDNFSYLETTKGEIISVYNNSNNQSEENISEENNNFEITFDNDSPEIIYDFQSPTYLEENEDNDLFYNCLSSKEECKINFDLRDSFAGKYDESDFECRIDFGFYTGEENKCNPNTIVFPLGTTTINFMIINKNNEEIYSTKNIFIVNNGYVGDFKIEEVEKDKKSNFVKKEEKLIIKKPKIIVESGVNKDNECNNKKNCKINFKYNEKSKYEKCKWDFGSGTYEGGINTKCNPGYVKFGTGKFDVNLRVYEKGDYYNFKESKFSFTNFLSSENDFLLEDIELENKEEDKKILEEKNIEIKEDLKEEDLNLDLKIKSIINLQGKVGSNKILNGNSLICYETCSVNFDGSFSEGNIDRFSWDFGNGERYEGINPGYIKYENYGDYKIVLYVENNLGQEDFSYFYVNYKGEEQEEILDEQTFLSSSDSSVLDENLIDYKTELNDKEIYKSIDNRIINLLYFLIFMIGVVLITLILKKEKIV